MVRYTAIHGKVDQQCNAIRTRCVVLAQRPVTTTARVREANVKCFAEELVEGHIWDSAGRQTRGLELEFLAIVRIDFDLGTFWDSVPVAQRA